MQYPLTYYADSHEKLGHSGDSIEWSYKALSVAPSLVDVRGRLASLLLKANRPYGALSLLQNYDNQLEAKGGSAVLWRNGFRFSRPSTGPSRRRTPSAWRYACLPSVATSSRPSPWARASRGLSWSIPAPAERA